MNIINDLDKENDDLMRHLGILQQLSLEQETNALKEISNYNDNFDNYENIKNKINNNVINNNNENKYYQNKKQNKKIMDMIRKKEEMDRIKNNKKNNITYENNLYDYNIKNQEGNGQIKKNINNNFEILEDNEKCIININNFNKNKKEENNDINFDNKKDNDDDDISSDDLISEVNINNKLIEDALDVEKKFKNNINNYNQIKNKNIKKENEIKMEDSNNQNNQIYIEKKIINIEGENEELNKKIDNTKDNYSNYNYLDKYNLDDDKDLDIPKIYNNFKNDNQNIKNDNIDYKKYNNIIDDDNNNNNYNDDNDDNDNNDNNDNDNYNYNDNYNDNEQNFNENNKTTKELEKDFDLIKKNKINIINDINKTNTDNNNINIDNKILFKDEIKDNNKGNNFVCDLDIFKKLQQQMNKKSEVLQKTIDKYNHKPKKLEIINDSNLIQNKINSFQKEIDSNNNINNIYNNIPISKINNENTLNINLSKEKININNKNLIEKINNIKYKIEDNEIKSNNINNKDKDKDSYIKKEISSSTSSYEPLIFKIPSLLLDNKIEEIEIYIKLEMIYYNLKTITSKLDFISLLRQVLNNILMLKNASFNVYMNLFNFILTLQIYELNLSDCNPSLPCEYLKALLDLLINNKDLTDMIRIIIFLIKKYFPVNMLIILEQKIVIILKVLNSYLKQLNNAILSGYINIKSIFIEINDFLFFSPPSLLSEEFPLAELYMEIYEEIKNTTDNIIKSCKSKIMKNELMDAVVFIKSKIKNPSLDYVKYLDYAIYKII